MLGSPKLETFHRCEEATCKIRHLCEVSRGLLEAKRYYHGDDGSCDYFYPVADLRGEELRGNPKHNQYTGGGTEKPRLPPTFTKRVKRRRDFYGDVV